MTHRVPKRDIDLSWLSQKSKRRRVFDAIVGLFILALIAIGIGVCVLLVALVRST